MHKQINRRKGTNDYWPGDPKWTMKIAEKYDELYDNDNDDEWTDAMN